MGCKWYNPHFPTNHLTDGFPRFLLARLHIDSLLDKRTKAKVIRMLESLFKGTKGSIALETAYHKAIVRIESQLPEDVILAKSVLAWLSYAQRPLTVLELCHALAVKTDDEELDTDNISDIDDIVSVCAGLVTVDEETQIIRLVHYTTQEYLETMRNSWIPEAQVDIAATCLTYLCFRPFRSGPCTSVAEIGDRLKRYPFIDYSAHYWGRHAASVQHEIYDLAMRLLREESLACWIQQSDRVGPDKYGTSSYYIQSPLKGVTALHIAAEQGLAYLCEEILRLENENTPFVNSENSHRETALYLAIVWGHKSIVELLLQQNHIRVNYGHGSEHCPLIVAVRKGDLNIVKLLLDTGKVNVNAVDSGKYTALVLAMTHGYEEVEKLLLKVDKMDANLKDGYGETPLMLASYYGRVDSVRLLLDSGKVDVNAKNNDGDTALIIAVEEGHDKVVKLLLDSGKINVNVKNDAGETALTKAVGPAYDWIVSDLLDVDNIIVDIDDPVMNEALNKAAEEGYEYVIDLVKSYVANHNTTA